MRMQESVKFVISSAPLALAQLPTACHALEDKVFTREDAGPLALPFNSNKLDKMLHALINAQTDFTNYLKLNVHHAEFNALLAMEDPTIVLPAFTDQSPSMELAQLTVDRTSSASKESALLARAAATDVNTALKTAFSALPDT